MQDVLTGFLFALEGFIGRTHTPVGRCSLAVSSLRGSSGQTAVEYLLAAGLLAVAFLIALLFFGPIPGELFRRIGGIVSSAWP